MEGEGGRPVHSLVYNSQTSKRQVTIQRCRHWPSRAHACVDPASDVRAYRTRTYYSALASTNEDTGTEYPLHACI